MEGGTTTVNAASVTKRLSSGTGIKNISLVEPAANSTWVGRSGGGSQ